MTLEVIKKIVKENLRCCYLNQFDSNGLPSRNKLSYSRDFKRLFKANFFANGRNIITAVLQSIDTCNEVKLCVNHLISYHKQYSQSQDEKYQIVAEALKRSLQRLLDEALLDNEMQGSVKAYLSQITASDEQVSTEEKSVYFKY
jgi:hypothetical protein